MNIPGAETLAALPNSAQAYVIWPDSGRRLFLTATSERGVFYAAQTLRQLLERTASDASLTIPLARVVDWPDIAERGEWSRTSLDDIVWKTRHKMNLTDTMWYYGKTRFGLSKEGRGAADLDQEQLDFARRRAMKPIPSISHLDQEPMRNVVFPVYLGLQGKGEHASGGIAHCPCCSILTIRGIHSCKGRCSIPAGFRRAADRRQSRRRVTDRH